jgi:hypothetical protein
MAELVQRRGIYTAISPEGLTFRIRTAANYPEQETDFWTAALGNQLEGQGYYPAGEEQKFTSPAGRGGYFEWGLPYNGKDYLYLTALCVKGSRIIILEAAGEQAVYARYRDALKNSLETVTLR